MHGSRARIDNEQKSKSRGWPMYDRYSHLIHNKGANAMLWEIANYVSKPQFFLNSLTLLPSQLWGLDGGNPPVLLKIAPL